MLCATNMKMSATVYNILSYLLKTKIVSYNHAIEWAYSKYSDQDVHPFIEKLALAADVYEMNELIVSTYQVCGGPSQEFLAGEIA